MTNIFVSGNELTPMTLFNNLKDSTMPITLAPNNEDIYSDAFKQRPQIRLYQGDAAYTVSDNPFGKGVWFTCFFINSHGGGNLIAIDTFCRIAIKALNSTHYDDNWTRVITAGDASVLIDLQNQINDLKSKIGGG